MRRVKRLLILQTKKGNPSNVSDPSGRRYKRKILDT